MKPKIEYFHSNQLYATKYIRNSKAIAVLWVIFTICYAIVAVVAFMTPGIDFTICFIQFAWIILKIHFIHSGIINNNVSNVLPQSGWVIWIQKMLDDWDYGKSVNVMKLPIIVKDSWLILFHYLQYRSK